MPKVSKGKVPGRAKQDLQAYRASRPQARRPAPRQAPAAPMASSMGAFQDWQKQQPTSLPQVGTEMGRPAMAPQVGSPRLGGSFPTGGFTGGGGGGLPQMAKSAVPSPGMGFQPPQDVWSRPGKLGAAGGGFFGRSATGSGGLY